MVVLKQSYNHLCNSTFWSTEPRKHLCWKSVTDLSIWSNICLATQYYIFFGSVILALNNKSGARMSSETGSACSNDSFCSRWTKDSSFQSCLTWISGFSNLSYQISSTEVSFSYCRSLQLSEKWHQEKETVTQTAETSSQQPDSGYFIPPSLTWKVCLEGIS